jgi:hypothetical protein
MSRTDFCWKFDPRDMFTAGPCFFVGSTGRGKTNTMLNVIAWHGHKFGTFASFCGSTSAVIAQSKCLPNTFIHYPYDDKAQRELRKLINEQERLMYCGNPQPLLLIFDDLMYDKSFIYSKEFRWLIFNSRAAKIWSMFLMQYCKHIPPEIRTQGFYAFLCGAHDGETREMLAETFAPIGGNGFRSKDHFFRVFDNITRDFGTLVVDRSDLGPRGSDHPPYYWYKPVMLERPVPLGGGIWPYHRRRYDPRWYLKRTMSVFGKEDTEDTATKKGKALAVGAAKPPNRRLILAEIKRQIAEHKAIEKPHAMNLSNYSRLRAKKLCLPF